MIESPVSDAALLERLRTLRQILPAMAADVASARREGSRLRREGSRLRRENAALLERLAALEENAMAEPAAKRGSGLRV
jgi:cell division protein FtsB